MTRTHRIAAAVAVLASLASAGPAAAKSSDPCVKKGRYTIQANHDVRIFGTRSTGSVFACSRQSGRITFLHPENDEYSGGIVRKVAGRFVAYSIVQVPSCKAACPTDQAGSVDTFVLDARSGRERAIAGSDVFALVLTRSGAAAWLTGVAPSALLQTWDAAGNTYALDSGDIPADSVKLSGGELRWTNGGDPHAVPFA